MTDSQRDRVHFAFLNAGHFLDHLFTLIFATVAAVALVKEWNLGYAELLRYATPGFFAFGLFSLPAGWLADKWSREGMMALFFVGIGAASLLTALAQSPFQVGMGLFVIGMFAAIYHPVGLAIVVERWKNTGMRLAVNGVWGNLGVGSAALVTGYFIDNGGWRMAFVVPGAVSIAIGLAYTWVFWSKIAGADRERRAMAANAGTMPTGEDYRRLMIRISAIVFVTTALSSLIFQSTTFALPKVFDERLRDIAPSATVLGQMAFVVFAVASAAQLVAGRYLDQLGPRTVFIVVAALQAVFFGAMPGLAGWPAFLCALAFMLAAFGQVPVTDYLIGKMATGPYRARIYGVRYVISFTVFALALPLISIIHGRWGFDALFLLLAAAAATICCAAILLPRAMPVPVAAKAAAV